MEGRIMTQNAPEQQITFSQEEVKAAESAEQAALSKSQNEYLTRRVVVLRAQMDRFRQDCEAARLEVQALREKLAEYEPEPEVEETPEETPESEIENSPEG